MGQLTFFFDRQIGRRLPEVLIRMAPPMHIRWHQGEGFKHDEDDDVWLSEIGKRGWVVIGQDRKWHKVPVEAAAVKQHNVRCFYLPCASESRWVSLGNFMKCHQKMMHLANTVQGPFVYRFAKNGQLYRVRLP